MKRPIVVALLALSPLALAPAPQAKSVGATDCAIAPAPARRVSADACAGPPPPTKPGDSTVSATVRVVFALQ